MKKEIGKRITKIREDLDLNKEEFAREIGISSQYLGMIEKGNNCLSVEKLKTLCEYTNLSADYILFGREDNLTRNTKELLSKYTDKQIVSGCRMLKNLALFIKNN